jgi:hypothetical protein
LEYLERETAGTGMARDTPSALPQMKVASLQSKHHQQIFIMLPEHLKSNFPVELGGSVPSLYRKRNLAIPFGGKKCKYRLEK